MISFNNERFGLGLALSLSSACLTFAAQAQAQDPMDPTLAPSGDSTSSGSVGVGVSASAEPTAAPAAETSAEASSTAEAKAEEPKEEPSPEVIEQADKGAAMSPEPPPASTTATGTSVEREAAVSLIGLESLPGSAYPSAYVRGLKYASLWRTFHGQQWPYMPQIGDQPRLRVGFSGYIWNDLSNSRISVDEKLANQSDDVNRWMTQTRGIVRVTPTYNAGDDWFVQGNAEVVIQGDMNADIQTKVLATTDDVWVRIGKWNLFDVTVGRFQAWEIANHFGMGLDWATLERQGAYIFQGVEKPTDGYGLNYFWDRQNYALGTYAVHVYPTKWLRGELLGHIGQGQMAVSQPTQMDIRPSAIFDVGFLKLKAGWEYGKAVSQQESEKGTDTKNGFGVAAQVVFDPYIEFGGSFARGFQDVVDYLGNVDLAGSNTAQTFGGFINGSPGHTPLVIGVGAYWNSMENLRFNTETGAVDFNKQQLMFAAVQYTLWEQLYIKAVLAHATNSADDRDTTDYTNTSTSGRLRIEFLY